MEMNLEHLGSISILELLGESIDSTNADDVKLQLEKLSNTHQKVILDLTRIRFLDSSGCGALIAGGKRFHEAGGELRLCNPRSEVKTVLEITRLSRILNMHENREHAIEALAVTPD